MTRLVFAALFGLTFWLFPCKGKDRQLNQVEQLFVVRKKLSQFFLNIARTRVHTANCLFKVTPHDEIVDFIIFDIFIDSYKGA